MKYNMCITYLIYINIVFLIDSVTCLKQFYPNLPVGEFRINYKSNLKCNITAKYNIDFNTRLNRQSASIIEILGNITMKVPLDDSLFLNINMAVKDQTGGWKDNAHVFRMSKACTAMKILLNKLWLPFSNAFGMKSNCPIIPGTYVSKGLDLSKITSELMGLKEFFYGSYKCRIFFTDKYNYQHGCLISVIDIKRPWETK